MIDALATYRIYLDHTDHLSDRELYTLLWEEELRDEGVFEPPGPAWAEAADQDLTLTGSL